MKSSFRSARSRTLLLMCILVCFLVNPLNSQEPKTSDLGGSIWGKLQKIGKMQGPPGATHFIAVGDHKYFLLAKKNSEKLLNRMSGKFVRAFGGLKNTSKEQSTIELKATKGVLVQEPKSIVGVVGTTADKVKAKQYPFVLTTASRVYVVSKRNGRKLKAFQGLNVEAKAYVITNGDHFEVAKIKSVKFKLAAGDRLPKTGQQAIAGHWTGKVTVGKVPPGVPGVSKGDTLNMNFVAQEKNTKATGTLLDTYKIVEIKAKKLTKKRKLKTSVFYSFSSGSKFEVKLEGKFSGDWKTYSGTWNSQFLGSGTFELHWKNGETN